MGQGLKGSSDAFPVFQWQSALPLPSVVTRVRHYGVPYLCPEESAALREKSTQRWCEPQQRTSVKHSTAYPKPALILGASSTLNASHWQTSCLRAAMGRSAAHSGTHSPWQLPADLQIWSGLSLLCNVKLVFEACVTVAQSPC